MREILFRGKRISNGEWVYGGIMSTFHPNFDSQSECDFFSQKPNCYCICANNKDYYVEQASIGQYTGLTDKNVNMIFEDDIVIMDKEAVIVKGLVKYQGAAFYIATNSDLWDIDNYYTLEAIGNIHDNPELLESEDAEG